MNKPKGWTGNLLTIDLTNQAVRRQKMAPEWLHTYIGARGFAARLLYDFTGPNTEPLDPENVVIIAAGFFAMQKNTKN